MKKYMLLSLPLLIIFLAFRLLTPITVKGKVTNHLGKAIPFASVVIKGTIKGTVADTSGTFSIEVPGGNTVLMVSAAGYQTKEVRVGKQTNITIKLEESTSLQEVVVTAGYGNARKKNITGSISRGRVYNKMPAYDYETATAQPVPNGHFAQADSIDFNTEEYDGIIENPFHKVTDEPLSTFSIDVDAASYSNMRRFLNNKQLPPAGAIRTEELINYFSYSYPQPQPKDPFSINTELSDCPWNRTHKLALIGLQGKKIPVDNLPPSNIVFLIDVSGSMNLENKLPLVQASMKLLTDQLREQDKISIVVYAGNAGLVLPATSGANKIKIKEAIDNLHAGGSTAGGEGIRLAYKTAKEAFVKEGNNRIVLCTDGDFNVGVSSNDELERLVERERESGVFLTVLGYGMGNYKDSKMQTLADKGNGNHAYIDGMGEAKKVLVNEFGGTLFTIAKDVKLQVEFNPALVQGYRLIGYENRMLRKEDFNDDKKDAGELGSGHTVTALYEIIPVGVKDTFLKSVDRLKYSTPAKTVYSANGSNEYMTVKLRYKAPDGNASLLIERPVTDTHVAFGKASENFRFASAVAEFGLLLRNSGFKSAATFNQVLQTAKGAKGTDAEGYRAEFIKLVKRASALKMAQVDEEDDEVVRN